MILQRCSAGPVRCKFKANADKEIVCSSPLSQKVFPDAKTYLVPLDSKGGYCPFFGRIEINDVGLEEFVEVVP